MLSFLAGQIAMRLSIYEFLNNKEYCEKFWGTLGNFFYRTQQSTDVVVHEKEYEMEQFLF